MAIHLITGSDEVLVGNAAYDVVHQLVGDADRSLMVDDFEYDKENAEEVVRQSIDAAQTLPFLTERRVVVMRAVGSYTVEQLEPLVRYLSDPSPSTDLVLVYGGGKVPKSLTDAVKAGGGTTTAVGVGPNRRSQADWVEVQVHASTVRLDAAATSAVVNWLGEEPGRLLGLLDTLRAAFGEGSKLGVDEVAPFLGEAGGVPPWDLTDAIDGGDTTKSLVLLHRMMRSGQRHPLAIMAILQSHYTRMLRLDGSGVNDPRAAASLLGIKSEFPAKKALNQLRTLGGGGLTKAIALLSQADRDLKGERDWPGELVMEVLVARLSRLAPRVSSRR